MLMVLFTLPTYDFQFTLQESTAQFYVRYFVICRCGKLFQVLYKNLTFRRENTNDSVC